MIPGSFDYHKPATLEEALSLLKEFGDDAKVLSGGHSLIPLMKLRLAEPPHLVDINGISDLSYIREEDGYLKIGALARESDLEESDLVAEKYAILKETSRVIADPQVRNMATVGGNIAHGDPANDHPAVMIALGAEVVATGSGGIFSSGARSIPIDEFFVGPLTTALSPGEILTEIRIPMPAKNNGAAYVKLERKVGDYAIAGVAASVTVDPGGNCENAGIGLTNVSPKPLRASAAEDALKKNPLSDENIRDAAQLASDASQPTSDHRGSEGYKKAVVKELCQRALMKARSRAEGGE